MSNELVEYRKGKRIFHYHEMDFLSAKRMYERIRMVVPYLKEPNYHAWANTLRLMQTRDGIDIRTIGEVFRWANQHEFWSTNILSPDKLRKQFARLHAQMERELCKPNNTRTKDRSVREQLNDRSWAE